MLNTTIVKETDWPMNMNSIFHNKFHIDISCKGSENKTLCPKNYEGLKSLFHYTSCSAVCHLESVHQSFSPSVLLWGRQTDPVLSDLYQMPCLLFEEDALPKESVCKKKIMKKKFQTFTNSCLKKI